MKMDFHSHFPDYFTQNATTKCEHMIIFIYWICEEILFLKDGIIHDTEDGSTKPYRCEDAFWILLVL